MADKKNSSFVTTPGFCPDCGSILPLLDENEVIKCYACKREWDFGVFGEMEMTHTIYFNHEHITETDNKENDTDGPVIERRCPQCQNDKMSYATLQLRSADEGQTVFYTCTKCKYKEVENS